MRFYDQARIDIEAGHGGRGAVSFLREKFRPNGGPDGGNGGRGGHITLRVEPNMGSLLDYKYKQHFVAGSGKGGSGCNRTGADGADLMLPVPPGTLIYDDTTGNLMADLSEVGRELLIARGGRGGKGNAHFASSTHQAPRFAQPGEEGEKFTIRLELKLLADVGLVGMPNAGKSSLIRAVTAARPKVADYPFTTLNPQLGVVKGPDSQSFVIADIPGLIEGASEGVGLGLEFLRHVERSRLLLHLIDISPMAAETPDRAFEVIQNELGSYTSDLLAKPQWIVLTKTDIANAEDVETWTRYFQEKKMPVFAVSSASHDGLKSLVNKMTEAVLAAKKTHTPQTSEVVAEAQGVG